MPHATLLVHQLRGVLVGKHSEIRDESENWNVSEALMRDVYLQNCRALSRGDLERLLGDEKLLGARAAVKAGYCDRLYSEADTLWER